MMTSEKLRSKFLFPFVRREMKEWCIIIMLINFVRIMGLCHVVNPYVIAFNKTFFNVY